MGKKYLGSGVWRFLPLVEMTKGGSWAGGLSDLGAWGHAPSRGVLFSLCAKWEWAGGCGGENCRQDASGIRLRRTFGTVHRDAEKWGGLLAGIWGNLVDCGLLALLFLFVLGRAKLFKNKGLRL